MGGVDVVEGVDAGDGVVADMGTPFPGPGVGLRNGVCVLERTSGQAVSPGTAEGRVLREMGSPIWCTCTINRNRGGRNRPCLS
ncbi:hypothetical protein GCM10010329_54160 [Streptomyces spiroverticillatus]|uniref:Uncharacterized protein n=1 Tax=Streptomyces finlayi TaxID=67296 RepID=A0A919CCG3_9ACTN|nr:hypothetical protein GCM10010329_54160 [Streptomyces spiroverticillatus]GHD06157.1 hypothetical protein GCM10010334_57640 [Streptomyces finlayi]